MTGAARLPAAARGVVGRGLADPRLLQPLLLALPFLAAIAVLRGLTVEIDTFHGSDARVYQLPTIMQFSERLDFSSYPSAQTPLFHLVMAAWGKLVGFELWKLRLLNAAISYAAVLALLRLLRRATPLEPWQAFAFALLFALSPYFFGASFTLLTDNLAILFALLALLALERIHRFRSDASLATLALACLAIAAAVLTRQSFVWLAPVAAWFLLRSSAPHGRRAAGALLLAAALAPLAALVIEWGGLVPPGADPASCGLCTDRPGVGRDALTLRTVGFTVAVFGLYAAVVHAPALLARVPRLVPSPPELVAALVAALVLLAVSPLAYEPIAPGRAGDAGYLWKASDWVPVVLGSSLLFWLLVPLGCLAIVVLVRRAGREPLPVVYLAAFLLAALPVRLVYQKYFDPFVLLALALLARPPDLRTRWDYAGIAVLCAGFVAYVLSFAG
jgi:4-amino-4-deoxy-L-arabinose transferase-like glycosyltransferase